MSDLVLYSRKGVVATLVLNRPEIRNVLSGAEMVEAIEEALERLNADREVRVAILTGAGPAFSAGGDLKRMRDNAALAATNPAEMPQQYIQGIQRIPLAFARLEVPIIAAVNGPAIGAGLDLACMCDIRIAAESAKFAESFVKLGITSGDGGAWFLPRIVGFSKACELSFTADIIDAAEALACGLVSRVVPDTELMAVAEMLALRIARNPGSALRMTKRLLQRSQELRLAELLDYAAALQALAHTTAEHRQAVETALDKISRRSD